MKHITRFLGIARVGNPDKKVGFVLLRFPATYQYLPLPIFGPFNFPPPPSSPIRFLFPVCSVAV